MVYDHRIPDDTNPTGDYCVPLYIPLDPQYTGLLLGALKTLEETEYYQRDPDYDDENAQIVVAQWRDRTMTPLIEAIATAQACGGLMNTKVLSVDPVSTKTTTSTTNITNSDAAWSYAPTKSNMQIRVANVHLANSGNNDTRAEIVASHGTVVDKFIAVVNGTNVRSMSIASKYSDMPVGTTVNFWIDWRVLAGTGTFVGTMWLLVEIIEWD